MRQLRKNERQLYYANYIGLVDVISGYTEVDGEQVPIKTGQTQGYTPISPFKANLSVNSGNTYQSEFGLNVGDYNAIVSANKGELPFTEQTLIWIAEPDTDGQGIADPETADYRVIAIRTSLNEERFILKARVNEK